MNADLVNYVSETSAILMTLIGLFAGLIVGYAWGKDKCSKKG